MANCHEMKKGEIYVCKDCGLELQVVAECTDCHKSPEDCQCQDEHGHACKLMCCGVPLEKK
ncbi:MAG: hypothetical protein RBU37_10075 [Myxococcota bacterium]|nr:hypothetical protein [Myxococcota bacterium]